MQLPASNGRFALHHGAKLALIYLHRLQTSFLPALPSTTTFHTLISAIKQPVCFFTYSSTPPSVNRRSGSTSRNEVQSQQDQPWPRTTTPAEGLPPDQGRQGQSNHWLQVRTPSCTARRSQSQAQGQNSSRKGESCPFTIAVSIARGHSKR